MTYSPQRDLIGYANDLPQVQWPHTKNGSSAKVALQIVVNYEEGGEHCLLNGDDRSEWLLSEIVGADPVLNARHMNMESLYEYGSRVGFWRLHRLLTERELTCTVFAVGRALEQNPQAAEAMKKAGWEIASHGLRWINYQDVPEEVERAHIQETIAIHQRILGERPLGIYQGKPGINTRRLIVEEGGFLYDADSYADELPYWTHIQGQSHLVVPYTLDNNDMRFAVPQGFNSGDQFFTYLKDSLDFMRDEGQSTPKMLSLGLHCRLVARPGRAQALKRFLDYVCTLDDVWVCQRVDIARHWIAHHPARKDR